VASTLYVTLDDLKLALKIEDDDTARDTLLTKALNAACRSIDKTCGRRFYLDDAATARTYKLGGRTVRTSDGDLLVTDDIGSEAGLVAETGTTPSGTWTAVTGWETSPDNALARGEAVTGLNLPTGYWGYHGTTRIRVTARWGWPAVPDDIAQAALTQAMRLFRRKDSPEGVTGSAEWGVVRLSRRDPDVWVLIEPYILPGFG
jgi:hypothetical protein